MLTRLWPWHGCRRQCFAPTASQAIHPVAPRCMPVAQTSVFGVVRCHVCQRQGDAANGTKSSLAPGAACGGKAAPDPNSGPAGSDVIIVLSDSDSAESADPVPGPARAPDRRPSSDGDATSPPSASGGAAQNGHVERVRAAADGGRAIGAYAADPLLKVFRQVRLMRNAIQYLYFYVPHICNLMLMLALTAKTIRYPDQDLPIFQHMFVPRAGGLGGWHR